MVVIYIAGEGVADYCEGVAAAGRGVELGYSASIQTCLAIG